MMQQIPGNTDRNSLTVEEEKRINPICETESVKLSPLDDFNKTRHSR